MARAKADQRRAAGQRTRKRLMNAALDQLAKRGEEGVTLRDVTNAAGANVAAVSYHFGSLQALHDAAIEDALERYLDAQQQAVGELAPGSSLEELAAAFARPMVRALSLGGRDLAVMRLVARSGIDPPEGWHRFDERFERIRADVVRVLKPNLAGVKDRELILRTRCVAGLLNWVVLASVGAELRNRPERQIERTLVPIVAGTFSGTSAA
jgi:AcrR family transcriptional regulator